MEWARRVSSAERLALSAIAEPRRAQASRRWSTLASPPSPICGIAILLDWSCCWEGKSGGLVDSQTDELTRLRRTQGTLPSDASSSPSPPPSLNSASPSKRKRRRSLIRVSRSRSTSRSRSNRRARRASSRRTAACTTLASFCTLRMESTSSEFPPPFDPPELTANPVGFDSFRRIRLEQLVASGVKKFTIAVIVCRPSQRIIGSISCDHVAGSEVRASLKPSTSPSLFPLPAAGADEVEPEVEETPVEVPVPRRVQSKPIAAAPAEAEPKPARKRPDGRYDCNHSCKDKSACKHLWWVILRCKSSPKRSDLPLHRAFAAAATGEIEPSSALRLVS